MKFITILLLLPSVVFACTPSCKLMTRQVSRYRVQNLEECLSIAKGQLGTEETYFRRVGTSYTGYDYIEYNQIVTSIMYVYKEPGLKTKGRISL